MPRLGIDRDFLRDYARLDRKLQDRVHEVFAKFEAATHAGIHLEKIANAKDDRFRSIRIDQFWRGVVLAPESGDTFTLLKVLPHDDAYTWAQRRQASVNAATGRIEIRDVAAIDATLPELSRHASGKTSRLFARVSDKDLRRLGVDDQTQQFARVLTDELQLEAARAFLPQHQWEALYGLAAGMSPDEVWSALGAPPADEPIDPDDVDAAVERTTERVLLVQGSDELLDVFRRPLDLWRIYLHPVQYQVAHAEYRGPARVTGGPGTGKTVVAIHRARHLAERDGGKVLVTTFTSNLAATLQAGLDLLVDDQHVRDRITVQHVDQFAHQVFRQRHGHPRLLLPADEVGRWREIRQRLDLPFTETFLAEEWRQVVLAHRVHDAQAYLTAKRSGRGRPLNARQRAQLWQAVWEFQQDLRDRRMWTHETVRAEATDLLAGQADKPFRHVVVDEAQDLSPDQWRLLRAAVPEAPNDMFVAGDTHQRIYHHRISLRDVGVRVSGRSTRLTVNYRTTAEILAWSFQILHGERIDNLDGDLESVEGYRCETHGSHPLLQSFQTRADELKGLSDQIQSWVSAGVQLNEIGIAARSNGLVEAVVGELSRSGIPAHSLSRSNPPAEAVAAGTMHRMKGLEFRCVAVVGVTAQQVPPANAVTPADEDQSTHLQDLQRERCLLFVACTRAREQLYVSWHGVPSEFIKPATDG
ncbi:UvrD-like helicase family protein [Kribbella sp. VKM Ac-2527]|uniref:DNA 3'-5' helicase n=1 Tax=Kribbella caucasensis TaxID=2512215 RepID=A0A4R6J3W2_9ACTN|nr:UvrD-helicase domain-containing protein [Kribbella sp. VKM Ac-2527]TDO30033.1 UvrD-like helicase family protein [Kribbella sp. VKM Ac-2527]